MRESRLWRRICQVIGKDVDICSNVIDLFWFVVACSCRNSSQYTQCFVSYVLGRTLGRDSLRVRPGVKVVAKQDPYCVFKTGDPDPKQTTRGKLQLVNTWSSCAHSAPEVFPAEKDCTQRHQEPPPTCVYAKSEQADDERNSGNTSLAVILLLDPIQC